MHAFDPVADDIAKLGTGEPHVIDGAIADLIVRLHGGACTGTPIAGTVFVVTAAHCVLTEDGKTRPRAVVRDGIAHAPVAVMVDTSYNDHPSAARDAAVLVMGEEIPGPGARVGSMLPGSGIVTLAGFQPVDSDGGLLRVRLGDRPTATGTDGGRVAVPSEPAGCVVAVGWLDVSADVVMVPCGLVPGASGGGLFTEVGGEFVLVGIVSTVTADLSANGTVPLSALLELFEHPDRYLHGFPTTRYKHHEQP